jgi:hypothetical protein
MLPVSKTALLAPTNFNLFLIFLKIGAILYGSGYVLLLFDAELVAKGLHTNRTIDAIAVGHIHAGARFPLSLLWAIKSMEYQHSFLRWRYFYPHLCLLPY